MALVTWATSLDFGKLDGMISGSLKTEASQVVRKTALDILATAQALAPVDTGYLKNSLGVGGPDNVFEVEDGGLVCVVGTAVEYANFQEWGTRFVPAHPFLTPAVEAVRPSFEAACAQLVERSAR